MISSFPTPSVPRKWLFLIAGFVWSIAGLILTGRALSGLARFSIERTYPIATLGIILGLVFYYSALRRVAKKNIHRIGSLPENVCLFAFTPWRGYIIIIIMVSAGIVLRHSSVPPHYLALLSLAMGESLFIGSVLFYIKFVRSFFSRK